MPGEVWLGEISADLEERILAARWTVYICAEPDGQDCDSGTHPNICTHRCAAVRRFHQSEGRERGPVTVMVEVKADEEAIKNDERA